MPKEHIDGRYFGQPVKTIDGAELPSDNAYVAVGWTKEYDAAQIGVLRPERGLQEGQDVVLREEGQWVDLDRDGINRLIRSLRKARDQAFGADA